eukprot:8495523-Pyramimonas_sp.AAC.1
MYVAHASQETVNKARTKEQEIEGGAKSTVADTFRVVWTTLSPVDQPDFIGDVCCTDARCRRRSACPLGPCPVILNLLAGSFLRTSRAWNGATLGLNRHKVDITVFTGVRSRWVTADSAAD